MSRHKFLSASYLILIKDGSVLLQRRRNTNFMEGWYGVPSGHVEEGEGARLCLIREIKEEIGIDVKLEDVVPVCVINRYSPIVSQATDTNEYIDFFFNVKSFEGEPTIMEENKCDDLRFFPVDNMPENTIPYVKDIVERVNANPNGFFMDEYDYNK